MTGADSAVRSAAMGIVAATMASAAHRTDARSRGRVVGAEPRRPGAAAPRVDRLGDDAVGSEEHDHGQLVGHDPARHAASGDQRGRQQDPGAGVLQGRPAREAEERPHLTVAPGAPDAEPEAEPGDAGARRRARRRRRRRPSVPPSASTSCSLASRSRPGSGPAICQNASIATTSTTVLPIGADGREREPVLGVEHGRGDRAEGVEQHLGDEEAQQVGGELDLLGGDRRIVDTAS